jgi:hypothetical protein
MLQQTLFISSIENCFFTLCREQIISRLMLALCNLRKALAFCEYKLMIAEMG